MIKFDYLLYLVGIVLIITGVFGIIAEHSGPVKASQVVSDNKYTPVPIIVCECAKVHESGQFCERYQVSRLIAND